MKTIAVVTASRAEYGLLNPLIKRIMTDSSFILDLIVTGTHLSDKHGMTVDEIRADGYEIRHEIPILDNDNSAYGISVTMANALKGFADCFMNDRPDIVVILGDRTEMLSIASAAMNERIPIAHIHGGELTEGAVDDCVRHAITKMSHIHFTANEVYRRRVIQMGEAPECVYNVGALGIENILSQELLTEDGIRSSIGIPSETKYAVVTFHPETLEYGVVDKQVNNLCYAMRKRSDIFFVITGANSDTGGDCVNAIMREFAENNRNAIYVQSLGMKRYLSAIKYAAFVLGNSSSGIIEAPAFGTPTVNIGNRQKGRLMAETVINCNHDKKSIIAGIDMSINMTHKESNLYGDGKTSEKIVEILERKLQNRIDVRKSFFDICFF